MLCTTESDCPCFKCKDTRENIVLYQRMADLQQRLDKAGINSEDFAELIFFVHKRKIDMRITEIVERVVKKTFGAMAITVDWKEGS